MRNMCLYFQGRRLQENYSWSANWLDWKGSAKIEFVWWECQINLPTIYHGLFLKYENSSFTMIINLIKNIKFIRSLKVFTFPFSQVSRYISHFLGKLSEIKSQTIFSFYLHPTFAHLQKCQPYWSIIIWLLQLWISFDR